jgi:hypothetical protein
VLIPQGRAQERDFDSLFLTLLAETLALGFEGVLLAPQRLSLVLKLGNGGSPPIGLLGSLDRVAPQVVEVGNELVIPRDHLGRFTLEESVVYREIGVRAVPLQPVKETISA